MVVPGIEHEACKVVKSLYDFKQAPKIMAWENFNQVLVSNEYVINDSDKYIYVKSIDALLIWSFVFMLIACSSCVPIWEW